MLSLPALALTASEGTTRPSLLALAVALLLAVVTLSAAYVLLRPPAKSARHGAPWWRQVAVGALVGAAAGGAVLLATDHRSLPHTDAPGWVVAVAVMVAGTGLGLVAANLRRTTVRRRILALGTAVVLVLVASVTVNIDRMNGVQPLAAPSSLATAPANASAPPPGATHGIAPVGTVAPTPDLARVGYAVASSLDRTWRAPAGMPTEGRLEAERIPGLASHFVARPAEVYLPPAALVPDAPALPVLILLSGQPASPLSVVQVGHAVATLNALAARNHGLAPILVVPDQLGRPQDNPMCVNSPLGNVATYVMTDVVGWIRTHLHVLTARDAWAIGGFSEGGTCSIQFASAHPAVFGSFVDVSGEQYPTLRTDTEAIREGFFGSAALYREAMPLNIMSAHGPYADTLAVFAVGADDGHYRPIMNLMSAAAASHGIHVARYLSIGTAHDWTTASNGFASGIGVLYERFGLAAAGQYLPPYVPPLHPSA